ncbi:MAG: hypothetical protein ACP5JJ_20275 [Anaerolineae bacterium]
MTLRRKLSPEDQQLVDKHEQQQQTTEKLRSEVKRLRTTFSLEALQDKLPLSFPTSVSVAEPLQFRALSWYTYPGWHALADGSQLGAMSAFYIALHVIDFSPLRAELVSLSKIGLDRPGQTPFDPLSLFLCCLLRLEKGLGWKSLAKLLAGPEGSCWRRLLGFRDGCTPADSTMRSFYKVLGEAFYTDLCPRFIELLLQAGLLPHQSTHPDTPPGRGLPLAADGMLLEAHSSMRCGQVTDRCYEPTSAQDPRPCPAKEAGHEGCDCNTEACLQRCRLTTPRDSRARLIHHSSGNSNQEDRDRGRDVYGYCSYAQVLCDDELRVYWVAYSSMQPANTDERCIFPTDFSHLLQRLAPLSISEVIADSAIGYKKCLDLIYRAKAVAMVTIRRHESDKDKARQKWRGYDKNGHLLCAHGYGMSFNGLDYKRLRACWVCRQVCRKTKLPRPEDEDCPFRDPDRSLGQVRHLSQALIHPDGTRHERLARLYPYGSALWKAHYSSRHNAIEGRNSQIMRLGLKRVWSYDLEGATADVAFADLLINLRTLGRLVQQATLLGNRDEVRSD